MKAVFVDCPPFLHELYRGELAQVVPDLEINLGSPSPAEVETLLAGAALAMNDHTVFDGALLAACPSLEAIVFLGTGLIMVLTLMYFPNGIVGTLERKHRLPRFLNWD